MEETRYQILAKLFTKNLDHSVWYKESPLLKYLTAKGFINRETNFYSGGATITKRLKYGPDSYIIKNKRDIRRFLWLEFHEQHFEPKAYDMARKKKGGKKGGKGC
jgi:hypothetical protein